MRSLRRIASPILVPVSVLALIVMSFMGCRSTQVVGPDPAASTYAEINEEARGRTVEIELRDGTVYAGYNLLAGPDSTRLDLRESARTPRTVPTAQVGTITIRKHERGALDGLGIGAAVGFGLGFVLSATTYNEGDFFFDSPGQAGLIGGTALAFVSGAAGALFGLIGGHQTVYRFDNTGTPERVDEPASGSADAGRR